MHREKAFRRARSGRVAGIRHRCRGRAAGDLRRRRERHGLGRHVRPGDGMMASTTTPAPSAGQVRGADVCGTLRGSKLHRGLTARAGPGRTGFGEEQGHGMPGRRGAAVCGLRRRQPCTGARGRAAVPPKTASGAGAGSFRLGCRPAAGPCDAASRNTCDGGRSRSDGPRADGPRNPNDRCRPHAVDAWAQRCGRTT